MVSNLSDNITLKYLSIQVGQVKDRRCSIILRTRRLKTIRKFLKMMFVRGNQTHVKLFTNLFKSFHTSPKWYHQH
ncbi:Toll-like receptor 2 [Frankliniella fusca]|uniref:Toll-like receptor 2 n=1 Tax=Frankliniella fusca TaxID=407009 RepID=A0AAE1H3D6_9NEOP|nr:Toll-like receptor 2 [Frankliniella fusca]